MPKWQWKNSSETPWQIKPKWVGNFHRNIYSWLYRKPISFRYNRAENPNPGVILDEEIRQITNEIENLGQNAPSDYMVIGRGIACALIDERSGKPFEWNLKGDVYDSMKLVFILNGIALCEYLEKLN